ncbi:MAG: asparagine synthase (glutamine-hydrolyzing) [Planctomycetes bacterium]|nr:asparagine synthase (glutamine-hydrolyzing) [Planctomycetota bacterium]
MCGICGFTGEARDSVLRRMVGSLAHRGPDDEGAWSSPRGSLGARRLSIVDVEGGRQPVASEDGAVRLVLNGEIYNHTSLRGRLLERGHRFASQSDTETLVHLYEEEGDDFLLPLIGMFAIALHDERAGKLLLARDRLGIKPLYYAQIPSGIVYGSEIKAVLAHPEVSHEIDPVALHHYLTLKHIPAPRTIYRSVSALRPGEALVRRSGRTTLSRYWRLHPSPDRPHNSTEAAEQLRALLEESVRAQMTSSDVPVGTMLSGGLDSSLITALASRHAQGRLKTFSLVYEDDLPGKSGDEAFAREMSRRLGTEHHEHRIAWRDIAESVRPVARAFDEPFAGVTSPWFLCSLIRRHVKVVLSGDGADELFGSYRPHRLAGPLAAYGERSREGGMTWTDAERQELRVLGLTSEEVRQRYDPDSARWRAGLGVFGEDEKRALYAAPLRESLRGVETAPVLSEAFAAARDASPSPDPLNEVLHADCETLLPDQVLAYADRLSMAHGVETRVPFLDHRIAELARAIPGAWKIHGGTTKAVLRQAARGILPDDLIDRPKEGFVLPLERWLAGPMVPFARQMLSPAALARHGLFRPAAVEALLQRLPGGDLGTVNRVWSLMMFQAWHEEAA